MTSPVANSQPVLIAPAAAPDIPGVVELCMQVEAQHEQYWPLRWKTKPGIREGYLRWLSARLNEPRMLILAAKPPSQPQRVVGALLAAIETEIPIYTFKEYAFIHDMAVDAEFRRHGIATRLLQHAREWSKKCNVNQLRLMVAEQNVAGQIAFEQFGFRKTYREMVLPIE